MGYGDVMGLVYFISDDGESVISLDCEEEINLTKKVKVTESSVMSGKTVSDGYREMNKVLRISGKVTYSKTPKQLIDGNLNPIEIQNILDSVIRNHHRFKVYTDESDSNIPLLKSIEQCVVEEYSVSLAKYINTIVLTLTLKEVFVTDAAKTGYLENVPSKEAAKSGSDPSKVKSSKEVVDKEESATMYRDWKDGKGLLPKLLGVSTDGN